ncbi:MAG: uroporphyrinogen decarboxylase [Hyphomicrobiales bacterium]|nr:uroporphyrinogen decarboxylase [Hyphomicrobiales bacterium]
MASTKPLLAVLEGVRIDPPPVWLMRQAGRFLPEYRALRAKVSTVLDLAYRPQLAAEATLQPVRRFGFDAAILFSDILVVPDALNQKVSFVEGEGPRLEPLNVPEGLGHLATEIDLDRLAPVFETISRVKSALPENCAMLGFCGAPWTVASYMIAGRGTRDLAPARLFAYRYPCAFRELIDRLVQASITYLLAQLTAGAEAVQIFESFAGAIPRAFFEDWSLSPIRRIVKGVRANMPTAKFIVFAKGSGLAASTIANVTGADAIGLDWSADPLAIHAARSETEPSTRSTPLQGNLDPLALVAGAKALEQGVERVLAGFQDVPHIFNLGHGILPETPVENVERLLELVRQPARLGEQVRA